MEDDLKAGARSYSFFSIREVASMYSTLYISVGTFFNKYLERLAKPIIVNPKANIEDKAKKIA